MIAKESAVVVMFAVADICVLGKQSDSGALRKSDCSKNRESS